MVRHIGAIDLSELYPCVDIDYHGPLGIASDVPIGNISFCGLKDGRRLVCVRRFGYRIRHSDDRLFYDRNGAGDSMFIIADKDFRFVREVKCNMKLRDFEDFRVVDFGDFMQLSATNMERGHKRLSMSVFVMSFDGEALNMRSRRDFVLRGKNYMPLCDRPGVFVSMLECNSIKTVNCFSVFLGERCGYCDGCHQESGGTPLVPYRGMYGAVVHSRSGSTYYHRFVWFSKDLSSCVFGRQFTVCRDISPVSFICGMSIEDDFAVLPFCVNDAHTKLFKIPVSDEITASNC